MKVYYKELTSGAQKALKRGDGTYRKFIVDGDHIAALNEYGRAQDWIKIHNIPKRRSSIK